MSVSLTKKENNYELERSIISQGPADAHTIDKTKFQSLYHVQFVEKQKFVLFVKLYFRNL